VVNVPAVAVNVAVVPCAATVTDEGTVKSALLLESDTVNPPAGALWDTVTVHVEVEPLVRVVTVQPRELSTAGAASEKVAVLVLLL
jgi:hypothetical protein